MSVKRSAFVTRSDDGYKLRDQDKPQTEWLAAIASDQTLTELRRGGPTRPPIRPRMEAVGWDSVPTVLHGRNT